MNIKVTLFHSKVARRMFFLFIGASLIPVCVLAFITFNQVSNHLNKQTLLHLQQSSKVIGLTIHERLTVLSRELNRLMRQFAAEPHQIALLQKLVNDDSFKHYFNGLGFVDANGNYTALLGERLNPPPLTEIQFKHIVEGGTLIAGFAGNDVSENGLYLRKALRPYDDTSNHLLVHLNPQALWSLGHAIPSYGNVCVFSNRHETLFCSNVEMDAKSLRNKMLINNPPSVHYLWQHDNEEHIAYAWPVYLQDTFQADEWTVVLTIPKSYILKPLIEFQNAFPPIILMSILIVAYISSKQIRKSLIPLSKLKAGTERLAGGDFNTSVCIKSNDEFEDLAGSFNHMAKRLDTLFRSLKTMAEVDRIMLSSLDADYILETVMERITDIAHCDQSLIYKIKDDINTEINNEFDHHFDTTQNYFKATVRLHSDDKESLESQPRYLFFHANDGVPGYLKPLIGDECQSFIVLPIYLREQAFALVVLCYRSRIHFEDYDFPHARELADRIAVAMTNADWEEKVYRQANYDPLTSLPNRRLLNDRLDQSIQRARRDGTQIAILLIDLDRFKAINDSLGHKCGDDLLRKISTRLKHTIKSADTLVRFGGDEFVVIIPDIRYHNNPVSHITSTAEQLLQTITASYNLADHEINITASIGISLYPTDSRNSDDLLKFAESAMYHSKSHGKGRYEFYSKEVNATSFAQLLLENDLRYAMDRNELEVYYQPQFDLLSGQISSAEALVRWNHPKLGILSPERFLPLADNTGLIVPLCDWVMENVCQQIRSWQDHGQPVSRVAINVSAHQFKATDFAKRVKTCLETYDINEKLLELEITEDAVMADISKTTQIMHQLNELGTLLAIDDFGTGYSSLNYLAKFPIHYLKIDRSFVRDLATDKSVYSIISAIIALAHSLNLKVIGEGVETTEQLQILKSMRCDIVQGYLISKPLSATDYIKLLERHSIHRSAAS